MSKKTKAAVFDAAIRLFNSPKSRMNEPAGNCDYLGTYYILRSTGAVKFFTHACHAHAKATKPKGKR